MKYYLWIFLFLAILYPYVSTLQIGVGQDGKINVNIKLSIPPLTIKLPRILSKLPKISIAAKVKKPQPKPAFKIKLPKISVSAQSSMDKNNDQWEEDGSPGNTAWQAEDSHQIGAELFGGSENMENADNNGGSREKDDDKEEGEEPAFTVNLGQPKLNPPKQPTHSHSHHHYRPPTTHHTSGDYHDQSNYSGHPSVGGSGPMRDASNGQHPYHGYGPKPQSPSASGDKQRHNGSHRGPWHAVGGRDEAKNFPLYKDRRGLHGEGRG